MRYVFGEYSLDPTHYELRQAGRLVPIEPRVFEVLAYLVQHAGQTITTEELLAQLYPHQFAPVERLTNAVTHARKALGETSRAPRYIQTVRRRGYRFMAPVTVEQPPEMDMRRPPAPEEILDQAMAMLQRRGRLTYGTLKRQFQLDDAALDDLKHELIAGQRVAVEEQGNVLVWTGPAVSVPHPTAPPASSQDRPPLSYTPKHLAEKILTTRSTLEGERKPVTVLFCDIANSIPLAQRLGPEAMHTLCNRFFALGLDAVHRYEGTINQFLVDGFMALFGAPIAYEDHARRAVLAALGLQHRLGERHADFGLPPGEELAVRMGLHTGLVVVGSIGDNLRMDYTAVGDTTHLAARLQQSAPPGVILLSQTTGRLVQDQVSLEAIAPLQVKGLATPVAAYKLLGTRPRRSPGARLGERTLSRFAGRERDLAVLHEVLAQVETGQGQVVGIVGEAGVGKSRFLYEFRQSLTGKRLTYLAGSCLSYGQAIPYLPLLDLLRHNCGITEADSPETIAVRVRLGLLEVGLEPEAGTPYLLHILGVQAGTEGLAVLSPEAIKTRTFDTLRQLSLRGSRQRPLLLEVEICTGLTRRQKTISCPLWRVWLAPPSCCLEPTGRGIGRPGWRSPMPCRWRCGPWGPGTACLWSGRSPRRSGCPTIWRR